MNQIAEIMDDAPSFPLVDSDVIDGLLGRYQQQRGYITHIAGIAAGEMGGAIAWFVDGNQDNQRYTPPLDQLFAESGAIAALNSRYWSDALALTDVYAAMPQARRSEWDKSIRERTTPEFTKDAVRPTINGLLADRSKFFGERVDGIFRGLSGEHVTNCPQGFSKRMIISGVTDDSGYANSSRCGLINDLRAIVAKFMGRDEPQWNATGPVVTMARRNHGEWLTIDGGALRMRVYMKGTAHLEVHPDMAYRLNQVLAGMYPRAIPAEFRTKPKKAAKTFAMIARPLPFAVLSWLGHLEPARSYSKDFQGRAVWAPIVNAVKFHPGYAKKGPAFEEAQRVLISIGGVLTKDGDWQFDYPPSAAIDEIIASGCIPDRVSHQYFPTPESVARAAVALAQIGPDDTVLEPSAGQGGIADYLPNQSRVICVEISKLHCDILRAKGFATVQADFIEWAARAPLFDRVILNPPFADGRAKAHLALAAELVKPTGRIVAVLPASMRGKDVLPAPWVHTWSDVFVNEFEHTGVNVVILSGVRA